MMAFFSLHFTARHLGLCASPIAPFVLFFLNGCSFTRLRSIPFLMSVAHLLPSALHSLLYTSWFFHSSSIFVTRPTRTH